MNILKQQIVNYVNAYLPAGHPILRDSFERRKLNISIVILTIVMIAQLILLPLAVVFNGEILFETITGGLLHIFISLLLILFTVITRAKFVKTMYLGVAIFFISLVSLLNISVDLSPPILTYHVVMFTVVVFYLVGRKTAIFVFLVQVVLLILLISYGILFQNKSIDTLQVFTIFSNLFISSGITLMVIEAYERNRNHVENELATVKGRLEEDMKLASSIQMDYLPMNQRAGNYYLSGLMFPASQVSGDYYDSFTVRNEHWAAIGDITGHGMQAGMLVMQVRSLLNYLWQNHGENGILWVYKQLNNAFFQSMLQLRSLVAKMYMSLLLLHIKDDGDVDLCGYHETVLLYKHKDNRVYELITAGSYVGIQYFDSVDEVCQKQTFHMDAGDMILLYTDGIVEAFNPEDKPYGVNRLSYSFLKAIRRYEAEGKINFIIFDMMADFRDYCSSVELRDDATLFLIKKIE